MEQTDQMDFAFTESTSIMEVKDVTLETAGAFTIIGFLRWLSEPKTVQTSQKVNKVVRDAVFGDNSGSIPISVWGDLNTIINEHECYRITRVVASEYQSLKLQTTTDSEATVETENVPDAVDLDTEDVQTNQNEKTLRGSIISCTIAGYKVCVKNGCNKKIFPIPGDRFVKCNSCSSKMRLGACKTAINGNLILEEENETQHELVLFTNVLNTIFDNEILTDNDIEDYFLSLEEAITVKVNDKNVIVLFDK